MYDVLDIGNGLYRLFLCNESARTACTRSQTLDAGQLLHLAQTELRVSSFSLLKKRQPRRLCPFELMPETSHNDDMLKQFTRELKGQIHEYSLFLI